LWLLITLLRQTPDHEILHSYTQDLNHLHSKMDKLSQIMDSTRRYIGLDREAEENRISKSIRYYVDEMEKNKQEVKKSARLEERLATFEQELAAMQLETQSLRVENQSLRVENQRLIEENQRSSEALQNLRQTPSELLEDFDNMKRKLMRMQEKGV
jgi:regulator of replication initiation timing